MCSSGCAVLDLRGCFEKCPSRLVFKKQTAYMCVSGTEGGLALLLTGLLIVEPFQAGGWLEFTLF